MRQIHDFYRYPPAVGQRIVHRSVGDDGWAWFALDEGEPVPPDADPDMTREYDGHHAAELRRVQ